MTVSGFAGSASPSRSVNALLAGSAVADRTGMILGGSCLRHRAGSPGNDLCPASRPIQRGAEEELDAEELPLSPLSAVSRRAATNSGSATDTPPAPVPPPPPPPPPLLPPP